MSASEITDVLLESAGIVAYKAEEVVTYTRSGDLETAEAYLRDVQTIVTERLSSIRRIKGQQYPRLREV